jgi:hypothetical protein
MVCCPNIQSIMLHQRYHMFVPTFEVNNVTPNGMFVPTFKVHNVIKVRLSQHSVNNVTPDGLFVLMFSQ